MKKMWKTINEVLNKTRKRKTFPEYLKEVESQMFKIVL